MTEGGKGGGWKKERKERYERERKEGGREAEARVRLGSRSARLPAGVCVGGGLCDKVKVKLASYLIWKVPVLHFSLSFCQDLAVAFLIV